MPFNARVHKCSGRARTLPAIWIKVVLGIIPQTKKKEKRDVQSNAAKIEGNDQRVSALSPAQTRHHATGGPSNSYTAPLLLNTVPRLGMISAWKGSKGTLSPSIAMKPCFSLPAPPRLVLIYALLLSIMSNQSIRMGPNL